MREGTGPQWCRCGNKSYHPPFPLLIQEGVPVRGGGTRRFTLENFIIEVTEQEIKREREKSRELRRSRWWQNKIAQGQCHWCGGKFPPEEMTMDHIIPITRGGKASRNNVVPCCKECNSRKKYLLPIEWEEYLHNLGKSEP